MIHLHEDILLHVAHNFSPYSLVSCCKTCYFFSNFIQKHFSEQIREYFVALANIKFYYGHKCSTLLHKYGLLAYSVWFKKKIGLHDSFFRLWNNLDFGFYQEWQGKPSIINTYQETTGYYQQTTGKTIVLSIQSIVNYLLSVENNELCSNSGLQPILFHQKVAKLDRDFFTLIEQKDVDNDLAIFPKDSVSDMDWIEILRSEIETTFHLH